MATEKKINVPANHISINPEGHLTVSDPNVINALKAKGVTAGKVTPNISVGIVVSPE